MGETESQHGRNWVPKTGEIESQVRPFLDEKNSLLFATF